MSEEYIKPKWGTSRVLPPGALEGSVPWTMTTCKVGKETYEYMIGHHFITGDGHYDLWVHHPDKPTEHTFCSTRSYASSIITEAIERYNKKHDK